MIVRNYTDIIGAVQSKVASAGREFWNGPAAGESFAVLIFADLAAGQFERQTMCGRYSNTQLPRFVENNRSWLEASVREFQPSFNVAPGQSVATVTGGEVRAGKPMGQLTMALWGFPRAAGASGSGGMMINARAETVDRIPMFRAAFAARRCLIIADGFYEWRKSDARTKQPFYFALESGEPFAFAGLWNPPGAPGRGPDCLLLTTQPNALVAAAHNRMPVILPPSAYAAWLGVPGGGANAPTAQWREIKALLTPYPAGQMVAHPVSTVVNSVRNNSRACIEPAAA